MFTMGKDANKIVIKDDFLKYVLSVKQEPSSVDGGGGSVVVLW
jgi:hypothetical protein